MSPNDTIQIVAINNDDLQITPNHSIDKLIHQKFSTPAQARNEALKYCSHEWVLFLDDDVLLGENFFQKSIQIIKENPQTIILGGPDQTPKSSGYFAKALGMALCSPMTSASTRFRHTKKSHSIHEGDEKSLILCNLWANKNFLDTHKIRFNELFFRNEENILINEVLRNKGVCLYNSQIYVYHYRKSNLFKLARSTFSSALHRALSFKIDRTLFSWIFLVPALWILYLTGLLILGHNDLYFAVLKVYFILSITFTLLTCKNHTRYMPAVIFYQFYINIIYGLGLLFGLVKLLFRF